MSAIDGHLMYFTPVFSLLPLHTHHVSANLPIAFLTTIQSSTPVCRIRAVATNDIYKFPRNNAASLLTWVQRVIPLIAIRATRSRAVRSRVITQVHNALNIGRCGAVEVLATVIVDIGHERIDVKASNVDVVPSLVVRNFVWCAVLVDLVECSYGFVHAAINRGGVHALLGGEILGCWEPTVLGKSVLW